MKMQESGEMYLETILILKKEKGSVRAIDISERMGFSKPSVSRAMGLLRQGGWITVERDGTIRLTESGTGLASKIYERHDVISQYLMSLGVSRETAVADACKIEHDISDETFEALKNHLN